MKTLIVYYSRSGVTEKVAEYLSERLNADLEKISEDRDRSGPIQYMLCGREALKEIEPPIHKSSKDPSEYDLVIFGTPVWAGKMSSPVRSYVNINSDKLKKTAVFCTHQGSGGKGTFESFKRILKSEPIAVADCHKKEVSGESFKAKIDEFANELRLKSAL